MFQSFRFGATAFVAALTLVACGGEDKKEPPQNKGPTISKFTADNETVARGQSVTLSYEVSGATAVRIEANGSAVLPSTENLTGTVVTPALMATTTFVLTAENAAGVSATRSVVVTVSEVQEGARITSFTANPLTIAPGGTAALTWQATGALRGRIEAGGATVYTVPEANLAAGEFQVTPAATTQYTLILEADVGAPATASVVVTVEANQNQPRVVSFSATPMTINAGQQATLAWTVENATEVVVTDASGATVFRGAQLVGSQSVSPAQTTTYTLTANGVGTPATAQATVTVMMIGDPARIVRFDANPATVSAGGSATLTWVVENATGIEIRSGGQVIHMSAQLQGTLVVMPTLELNSYELTALGAGGNATATVTVPVGSGAPAVQMFRASPSPLALGASVTLEWTVANATTIRILNGTTVIHTTSMPVGTHAVVINAERTEFFIEASDASGATDTNSTIVWGHGVPAIQTFTVTPNSITGPTQVTVAWSVENVSQLRLLRDGQPVLGFPVVMTTTAAIDVSGSMMIPVTQATTVRLEGSSAGGQISRDLMITQAPAITETEPNNTIAQANPFPMGGVISGELTPAGDTDVYAVTVPLGGNVRVATSDGLGGCATDTVVGLLNAAGQVITFDDDSGTVPCSLIDPQVDRAASDLAAGTYYVVVVHENEIAGVGSYVVDIAVGAPSCGNGIPESRTNEQCDDGAVLPNDGCSATCQLEINPTVISGMGGNVTVNFPTATAFSVIQVTLTQPGMAITATAADTGGTTCNTVNTTIALLDSQRAFLGLKEDGGPTGTAGDCGTIRYPADAFARNLPAGTYYVVAFNEGPGTGTIQVRIGIRSAVCGNEVVESLAGEECDNPPGPGLIPCNAMCRVNTAGVVTLPAAQPVTLSASIPVAGEFNLFRVTVTHETLIDA